MCFEVQRKIKLVHVSNVKKKALYVDFDYNQNAKNYTSI